MRTLPHKDWKQRQEITLELAGDFLTEHKKRGSRFTPLGVAQGWSPASYAYSVEQLQNLGFSYIAMGGMVPLKTHEILACLERVNQSRHPDTRLHLLGITRCEQVREFARFGAASFDSTSPLRQAFKDLKDNYWTLDRTYSAIRVPQVQANPSLLKKDCGWQGESVRSTATGTGMSQGPAIVRCRQGFGR